MSKKLFSALPNFNSKNLNVDRENGVLKNTCIALYGENKNDSFFDETFLADLVKLGNEADGIKSRFGHPNACATSFGTFIGRYKNFNIQNENVYADLHLDPITKKTQVEGKGIMMFDYIMDMAESNPDMFGNSICIYSQTYQKEINGELQWLHKLASFKACDLVDDPAATDSLFSNSDDLGAMVTNFLDNNPKIFDTISKKPEIIQDFFERYTNYSNRKSLINFNMSFLKKLTKKIGSKKEDAFDIDLTLADGSIVTVITDASEPQVGDQIVDDSGSPLADGEYVLPDGSAITVVGGMIDELTAKVEDDTPPSEDPNPVLQEVLNSVSRIEKAFNTYKVSAEKIQQDNEAAFDVIANKLNALGKTIKSKYDVPAAEEIPGKSKIPVGVYDADKAKEIREKSKNK
ncbi:hypothetical protein OX284_014585 [Flavobacterium sp. SUN046]|uniref:hypothetical protein n=1 Tax=Flavobacterium sp. SUN046 TaxID=3002440 RepID=UPI002DBF1CF4|nr:hypothetical protein [Flavobacterium sp. SUN046]MEC4050663.1 hypothetical protein [Flavobacterium sp. SUN046]